VRRVTTGWSISARTSEAVPTGLGVKASPRRTGRKVRPCHSRGKSRDLGRADPDQLAPPLARKASKRWWCAIDRYGWSKRGAPERVKLA
jgi:hypothetical protein